MAKTNMVEREKRRAQNGEALRDQARASSRNSFAVRRPLPEDRAAAQATAGAAARCGPDRQRNRCAITGRSRGVYRKFGLARVQDSRGRESRRDSRASSKASW